MAKTQQRWMLLIILIFGILGSTMVVQSAESDEDRWKAMGCLSTGICERYGGHGGLPHVAEEKAKEEKWGYLSPEEIETIIPTTKLYWKESSAIRQEPTVRVNKETGEQEVVIAEGKLWSGKRFDRLNT